MWDVATGDLRYAKPAHAIAGWGVRFSRSGRLLATEAAESAEPPKIWDAATGTLVATLPKLPSLSLSFTFSPDDQLLLTAHWDGTVRAWSTSNGRPHGLVIRETQQSIASVELSPDGKRLLTAGRAPPRIWDLSSHTLLLELPRQYSAIYVTRYSPDGRLFATAHVDEYVARVWDASTGRLVATMEGHKDSVTSVWFSPDGRRLATASRDGTAKLWEVATGRLLQTMPGAVYAAEFSPDGNHLLTAGFNGHARIWNVELDERSPDEVDRLVAQKSPWRLVDGRLVRSVAVGGSTSH